MAEAVLDTSAVLAVLLAEPGGERVVPLLDGGLLSAVNACELQTRLVDRGLPAEAATAALAELGVAVVPFGAQDAAAAVALRAGTRRAGLSLGDRACLALARRTGLPVYTADRPWADLDLPFDIRLIR